MLAFHQTPACFPEDGGADCGYFLPYRVVAEVWAFSAAVDRVRLLETAG